MKNKDNFHYACNESCHVQQPNQHFSLSAKMNGTQRKTLISLHCTNCGVTKGTSQAEAMSNSEKIKLVVLAIIELCLLEGSSQSGKVVSQKKIPYILLNSNFF